MEGLTARKVEKVVRAAGLSVETMYSLDSFVPVTGTIELVRYVLGPTAFGAIPLSMRDTVLTRTVPRIGHLFFSGLQATEQLTHEVSSRFSSIGRGV